MPLPVSIIDWIT